MTDNIEGFAINGAQAGSASGRSVSGAGDINGDGLADLIVGAPGDNPNGPYSGASFVVFGKTDSTAVQLSTVANGIDGFIINGIGTRNYSGHSISNAGDVNGDGLADIIVGAPGDNPNGANSGASFIVFGKTDGTAVELSAIETGIGGFAINGIHAVDYSGRSVSGAGDINGDGLTDLIVGAPGNNSNGSYSGTSFVVFGKTDGTAIALSAVEDGIGGFVINGVDANNRNGKSVSNAGDVNGDGLTDLIVGVPYNDLNGSDSGAGFVIFGKTDGEAVELSTIESNLTGFAINGANAGDRSGFSVSRAGDVNGDGLADLIVGAPSGNPNGSESGTSFVVFGKTDSTAIALSTVENGTDGFVINGVSAGDNSGSAVSGAGDVNGDGLADLIVGAPLDDPNGNYSGASFIVFGKNDSAAVQLSDIENGLGGFVVTGVSEGDTNGFSVSRAGDVNGDGFTDLIVGVPHDDPNGSNSGASFVIFGGQGSSATVGTVGADTLIGDATTNQLVAGSGDDILIGNGGADVLRGGVDNDILAISDLTFSSLDGGTGKDTLRFDTALNLDLRTLADTQLTGIEIIDLTHDSGNSTLSLNLTDLLNLSETQTATDTLVIHGNTGDTVRLDKFSNGQTGSWIDAGSGIYTFTADNADVLGTVSIDTDVTVNILPNQATLATIQKNIILAAGIPSSNVLRDQITKTHNQTDNFNHLAPLIDDFMNRQVLQNEEGVSGVLQTVLINGFSLNLTEAETSPLVTDLIAQGINSWSKLFSFLTTDVDADLGTILDNRAAAANLFTDLLSNQNRDNFYSNSLATNTVRTWLADIDTSEASLLAASSSAQDLINRFFIPAVELSAIKQGNDNNGFVINGISDGDASGTSVSSADDVNGDGLVDLIVGAPGDDPNGERSGASFVVFGKTDGTAVQLSTVESDTGGFVINGTSSLDYSGFSVSGGGDVNGDGLADLIVGAPQADSAGINSGAGFVVFGKTDTATVELSSLTSNNNGFVINGLAHTDYSGQSVSNAGDVNGDGLADLIMGAPHHNAPNGSYAGTNINSGASYVAFGSTAGRSNDGFLINGINEYDHSGTSVSGAGDVNGDGLADLIVGAPDDDTNGLNSGASFVVFGKTNDTTVALSDVKDGLGGFVINGVGLFDNSGQSVSGAGDVNGDGLADLIVGAPYDDPNGSRSGAGFVVFGKTDGIAVELSDIEAGTGGFMIKGAHSNSASSRSVSHAGDVNGDGLADLIVSASGNDTDDDFIGTSFVIFGKTDGTAVELSDIESGNGGFVINSENANGQSSSSAGDVNGDGFADLIVGTSSDDSNGNNSGASYVIFGGQGSSATVGTSSADTLTGNATANQLVAGLGDDVLIGNGGADVLRGGAGNDILAISDPTFASLDGGTGVDTLRFDAALDLDLRTLADTRLVSIEIIDLTHDDGNSTLSLNLTDLLNLNEAQTASDTLVIHGDPGDTVNLDNTSNGQTGNWINEGSGIYTFSANRIDIIGTVTIDTDVTVHII